MTRARKLNRSARSPAVSINQPAIDYTSFAPVSSTSVWQACQNGDIEYLQQYLNELIGQSVEQSKRSINLTNEAYETPLHLAASNNQLECVSLLLSFSQAVNYASKRSVNQSDHANKRTTVNHSINQFVSINQTDRENGWTALHRACVKGHLSIAALLIRSGADPTIVDHDRCTAFDLLVTRDDPSRFVSINQSTSHSTNRSTDQSNDFDDMDSPTNDEDDQRISREAIWHLSLSHQLYAFGSNSSFTLGVHVEGLIRKPMLINFFHSRQLDVCHMSLTRSASFALTSGGDIFAMGTGTQFRLGLGDTDTAIHPRLVSIPARVSFVDSCDKYSCAVSAERNDVFVWGNFEWLTSDVIESYHIVEHIVPKPLRLDSCRSYRIVSCSCSQYRLCLLTARGELFYIGQAMEDQSITLIPKPVLALSHLSISKVIATRDCIIALTKDGEIHQQVRKDRRAHRVALKFSTASMFTSRNIPYRSSPRQDVSAAPTSPILTSISSLPGPSLNRRLPAVKKIVVSPSGDRALAVTDQGEAYWWKPLDIEPMQPLSLTHSPPLRGMSDPTDVCGGGGRRMAHLVQGLSFIRVVDACLGKGHTTIVTSVGDVYHWGPNSLTHPSSNNQSHHQPHRIHYLHAADRVWCTDSHVHVSTVYRHVTPPTIVQLAARQQQPFIPSLRSICEFNLMPSVNLESLFAANSYSIALSLPSMFDFTCEYIFSNLNILIHPLMKKASMQDLSVIEAAYQRGISGTSSPVDYAQNCRMDSSIEMDDDRFTGVFPFALSSELTEHSLSLLTRAIDRCREEKVFGFRLDDEPPSSHEASENESDWTTDSQDEAHSEASEIEFEHNGQVNLFAGHQRERQQRMKKVKDAERRKQRRLRKLDERLNQASQAWRVGMSPDEIAAHLRSELRTLVKKEKRRETRENKRLVALSGDQSINQSTSPVIRAADAESRDFFIRSERIRSELGKLADDGCSAAIEWMLEQTSQIVPTASPESFEDETKQDVTEVTEEKHAVPAEVVKPQSVLRATAVAFDATLNRPVRALNRQDERTSARTPGRHSTSSLIREIVDAASPVGSSAVASSISTVKSASSKPVSGWSGSPAASPAAPAQLPSPVSALGKSPPAPSMFALIQREQAELEAKRAATIQVRNQTKQPVSKASAPLVTPIKHAAGQAVWGSPAAPSSVVPPSTSPTMAPLASPSQALSLAEIQAEESRKQKLLQQQRQQQTKQQTKQSPTICSSVVRPGSYSPPSSAASPHFSLADFIPLGPAAAQKASPAASRTWSTPAVASTRSPSSVVSFREIQQTEAQRFTLPMTIANPHAPHSSGRSLMSTSSPWGRHAALHDTPQAAPITAIAAIQLVEEERRLEAEALQEANRLIKAHQTAEAKERKARAKAAKKSALLAQKQPDSSAVNATVNVSGDSAHATSAQPKRASRPRKPKQPRPDLANIPHDGPGHGASDHPTAATRALRAAGGAQSRPVTHSNPPRDATDRKPKQPRNQSNNQSNNQPNTQPTNPSNKPPVKQPGNRQSRPPGDHSALPHSHPRPPPRAHDPSSRVTEVH